MAAASWAPPPPEPCRAEVELRLWTRVWQPSAGLLALAVLLGLGLGGGAAALLGPGALGPRLLRRRQKDDSQRLVEGHRSAAQNHQPEDFPLPKRKERETWTATGKEDVPALDVAEFALKAKVIYPINQKFRPLADGSSNPSLHDDSAKQPALLPHQILGGSSSSSLGSLSQGAKEDRASSTTTHSAASDGRDHDQAFLRVTAFAQLLTCDTFDVKMCLYSLFLKHLQLLDVKLRKQKHVAILHIFRMHVVSFYLKKKISEDSYQSILRTQEAASEELQTQLRSRLLSMEVSGAHEAEYQTLDDLERSEKGYADHVLDNMEAFWKQTDHALLFLLDQSKCSSGKAKKIRMCLAEATIAVEESLRGSQDLQAMAIQERMFNWEQLVKIVGLLKTQMQEESKCRLHAISHTLDVLVQRNNLSVKQKEELLTGIQKVFWETVELYEGECMQLGKNLIQKCLRIHTEKIESLLEAQEEEQRNLLNESQQRRSLDEFLKVYCEMSKRQRKAQCELEEESDCETSEAVVDVYKKLYSQYSGSLEELVVQLFLQTLPVLTSLPRKECELLKEEQQEDLALQLEKSESQRQRLWTFFQEQIQQEQKLWMEDHAFSAAMQRRLSETNEKIMQGVTARLGGLSKAPPFLLKPFCNLRRLCPGLAEPPPSSLTWGELAALGAEHPNLPPEQLADAPEGSPWPAAEHPDLPPEQLAGASEGFLRPADAGRACYGGTAAQRGQDANKAMAPPCSVGPHLRGWAGEQETSLAGASVSRGPAPGSPDSIGPAAGGPAPGEDIRKPSPWGRARRRQRAARPKEEEAGSELQAPVHHRSSKYLTQKHKSLFQSVLRRLALRQIALSVLAKMRTSRRRTFVLELKEHQILQQSSSHCFDELQWKQLKEMESHVVEEEEKLASEVQQTRLEFHQQLTAETQESLQFLHQHLRQVIGQALVQHARQLAAKHDTEGKEGVKGALQEMLKETSMENVCMTSDQVHVLLHSYLEQVAKIQESHEDAAWKALQERTECRRHQKKGDCEQGDGPDPPNASPAGWERTPQKPKRVWAWFDVQQRGRLAALKQKMVRLNRLGTELENKLMRVEQQFVRELSAAVRLPLPVHKRPLESAVELGKKPQPKRLDPPSREREEEHSAKEGVSPGQASKAFRNKWQSHQEEEAGHARNPEKLLEKRCKKTS